MDFLDKLLTELKRPTIIPARTPIANAVDIMCGMHRGHKRLRGAKFTGVTRATAST